MASRRISDLEPIVRKKAEAFEAACKAEGLDILIYCTYRSPEEQDELYAQGRTKPGNIVTNARGGQSFHNFRCAFDFVPLLAGKPQWGDKALYLKVGIVAESVGLEWAGRWTGKFKETAHCQFSNGLSLRDLQLGKKVQ